MDNGGATYGGVTFESLGLLLLKANVPVLPDPRQVEEEPTGLDGAIDLDFTYGPRLIDLEVMLLAADEAEYQYRLAQLAKVFNGRAGVKPLVLDRMTGKRWMAKYAGTFLPDKIGSLGTLTLPFKCFFPFSESVIQSSDSLEYGDGLMYGMGLRYGDVYSWTVNSSPRTVTVYHAGTHEAYPVIRLSGAASNITVTNNTTGEAFTLTGTFTSGDVVEIHCAPIEQFVTKNGTDVTGIHSGKFLKLVEGENSITIEATAPNMTVAFIFRHTYLY